MENNETQKYEIINQSGEVLDTAEGIGQARYLADVHLFGQRSVHIVPIED